MEVQVITVALTHWLGGAGRPGGPSVSMHPDAGQLPGSKVLQALSNGVGAWALAAAMIGLVLGAIMWAFGHYSQNYQQAYNGRRGVLVSGLAAILIGGAPHIINFFFRRGIGIQ